MMKSLHHVPAERMDAALAEVARAVAPSGLLIVFEPVAEGAFDEIIRHFHDERSVRAAAQAALDRCRDLMEIADLSCRVPCRYANFAECERRVIQSPTVGTRIIPDIHNVVQRDYMRRAGPGGKFLEDRPFRARILKKPD